MLKTLFDQIRSFDTDEGVSESVYKSTVEFINRLLGERSGKIFVSAIEATDGHFYYSNGDGDIELLLVDLVAKSLSWDVEFDNTGQAVVYTGIGVRDEEGGGGGGPPYLSYNR